MNTRVVDRQVQPLLLQRRLQCRVELRGCKASEVRNRTRYGVVAGWSDFVDLDGERVAGLGSIDDDRSGLRIQERVGADVGKMPHLGCHLVLESVNGMNRYRLTRLDRGDGRMKRRVGIPIWTGLMDFANCHGG